MGNIHIPYVTDWITFNTTILPPILISCFFSYFCSDMLDSLLFFDDCTDVVQFNCTVPTD